MYHYKDAPPISIVIVSLFIPNLIIFSLGCWSSVLGCTTLVARICPLIFVFSIGAITLPWLSPIIATSKNSYACKEYRLCPYQYVLGSSLYFLEMRWCELCSLCLFPLFQKTYRLLRGNSLDLTNTIKFLFWSMHFISSRALIPVLLSANLG